MARVFTLLVTVSGGRLWRFNYRYADKNKTLALGTYPEVTLAEARTRRDQARQLIANDVDPGDIKKQLKTEKAERAANTFEKLAREWHERQGERLAEKTHEAILNRLERYVFQEIGSLSLADPQGKDILEKVLRPIEKRGTIEMATLSVA